MLPILSISILLLSYLIYPFLQHIVQIGGAFTSKTVCTGVFLSRRSVTSIIENELAGLSATLFVPDIDNNKQTVTSSLLGLGSFSAMFGLTSPEAKYLGPKFGCQLQPKPLNSKEHKLVDSVILSDLTSTFRANNNPINKKADINVEVKTCVDKVLDPQFTFAAYKRNQTRAAIVFHKDHIISEKYQSEFLNI